ncbi:hypothetical protein SGLAM104S_03571 [Streptomyces glaucescens]
MERAPVGECALAVGRAQGDQAEDGHQGAGAAVGARAGRDARAGSPARRRLRRPRRFRCFRRSRRSRRPTAQERRCREGGDEQTGHGQAQQVPGGGQRTRHQCAQAGADHAAEAERGVEARHDRPAKGGYQFDRRAVEGDVDPAVGRAEDQQHRAECERGVGERGQGDTEREQDRAGDGDLVVAEPAAQPSGEDHRDDRTGGDAEQGEAEGAGRGAGLLLDGGDADHPSGEDEAVEGEEDGQGCAEPGEVAVGTRHDAVRTGFVYLRHKVRVGAHRARGKGWRPRRPGRACNTRMAPSRQCRCSAGEATAPVLTGF